MSSATVWPSTARNRTPIHYYKDVITPMNAVGTVEDIHERTMTALQK
ncbi:MAG: hypothetical protein U1U88_000762 [Lawsonella clevelandensis]